MSTPGTKHKGWRWDVANSTLDVYIGATEVATFGATAIGLLQNLTITGDITLTGNVEHEGTQTYTGAVTIGESGDGHSVVFWGDTAGNKVEWDPAANGLYFIGGATLNVVSGTATSLGGALNVAGNIVSGGVGDFAGYVSTAGVLNAGGNIAGAGTLAITGGSTLGGATSCNSTLTVTGITTISNATASTSTVSGAIVTTGGVGIAKDVFIGGDFYLATGKKIDFNAGDVTITHASNLLTLDGGTLKFTSAQTDYILIGTSESSLLTGSIPASPEVWDAVGVFVNVVGTSTRTGSMGNENHAGNFMMQESGQTYFNFGLQGRSYVANNGTAIEMYGVHGRARILSGGTVGSGSAGGFIGVLGEANNQSGGTVDMGAGTSIYAGVRGIFNNGGTLTAAGKSCGVMADVGSGTSDCVLYMLSGGGTTSTSIMEINNSGTSTNLLKIQTAAGFASVNASFSGAGEPDASLEVLLGGSTYFLYLYDTEVT